jgi:predicted DNA-binding transcriptional regulator AlpA
MRFLVHADLAPQKGIKYSAQHIKWLVKKKRFPPPVHGVCRENAWPESAIDEYLKDCVAKAERDRAA